MSIIRKHFGFVRNVLIMTLAVAIILLSLWGIRTQQAQALLSDPTPGELAAALHRAGLDPESLTAVGISSQAVGGVALDVMEALIADPTCLSSADSDLASARIQEDDLGRTIRAGQATPEQVNAYPSAASQLLTAQNQCQGELDALFTAGAADLATEPKTLLARIRANRGWELPVAYLVVNRSQSEWVQLRDALAHERIAQQSGDSVDSSVQTFLTQVRNNADVSNALAYLDTNLANVQTAWNISVYGQ